MGMHSHENTEIENAILQLSRKGCSGTEQEFLMWLQHEGITTKIDRVKNAIKGLVKRGLLQKSAHSTRIFEMGRRDSFPSKIEYTVPGKISLFPVPYIRTQVEAFLRNHTSNEEIIADILIGTTEAVENAIKYNSSEDEPIRIKYGINDDLFSIQIVNKTTGHSIEHDINRGKFDPSTTLMRGMLIIMKLFDTYEISITDNNHIVTFYAEKKLA